MAANSGAADVGGFCFGFYSFSTEVQGDTRTGH